MLFRSESKKGIGPLRARCFKERLALKLCRALRVVCRQDDDVLENVQEKVGSTRGVADVDRALPCRGADSQDFEGVALEGRGVSE